MKSTFIFKSAVQYGCRTGWMQDRTDQMQNRLYTGQDGCRTGRMQDRTDAVHAGQVRCETGWIQNRSDAVQ